jgi:Mrp family chromosome partitioning ATPase
VFLMKGGVDRESGALTDADVVTLIAALRERYDFVVLDVAPLLASDQAGLFARLADAVALVVRWGVTREDTLRDVAAHVRNDPLRLAGTVLAEVDERRHAAGRYGGRPQYHRAARRRASA